MTLLIKVFVICISMYAVVSQNTGQLSPSPEPRSSPPFNERFFKHLIKCVLNEGVCDSTGKRLKTLAPFVLRGQCTLCSPREIQQIREGLSYVQRYHPAEWAKFIRLYSH